LGNIGIALASLSSINNNNNWFKLFV
jgi:hypothetical protein